MLTFLTKLRFNSLLRAQRRRQLERRRRSFLSGLEDRTKPRRKEEKKNKEATRLTTFQSLRYSAVDTFRSSVRLDATVKKERASACFSSTLLRENEIDPLHSGLEENRNPPPPPFTRQFSSILLTFLLRFPC